MTQSIISEAEFLAEVEQIKRDYPASPPPKPSNTEALTSMVGMFADDPTWESFVRGMAERRAEEYEEARREADAQVSSQSDATQMVAA